MSPRKGHEFWGPENGRLRLWEFLIRAVAVALTLTLAIATFLLAGIGCVYFGIESQSLRDVVLIFVSYIVLAIRRERHGWVFVINTLVILGLLAIWIRAAMTGDGVWSQLAIIVTVGGTLGSQFFPGETLLIWQAKETPREEPTRLRTVPTAAPMGRTIAFLLTFVIAGRLLSKRRC